MGSAWWLLLALPEWFFSSITAPFSAGILTLIPSIGIMCLVGGLFFAIKWPAKQLLLFVIPFILSEAFVFVAGAFRGSVPNPNPIIWTFLGIQMLIAAFFMYRFEGSRVAASLLSIWSLSYAFFALFVASMAFTDSWL